MRYRKQILFKQIGPNGQEILRNSSVAIIGVGGLGTNSAELLTRAGIGSLILIDKDVVELDNLQRQTLFTEKDIGKPKAKQAKSHLNYINSEVKIIAKVINLTNKNIHNLLKNANLILDCTDNLETRFLINRYCIKEKKPWIYASVAGSKGFILNLIPGKVCFECIINKISSEIENCKTIGIINTIPRVISALQVTEAIKILLKEDYSKDLIYYDLWNQKFLKLKVKKRKDCKVCK